MTQVEDGLQKLKAKLAGELHTGKFMRRIYATDASAYQEMPLAVAIPKNEADLQKLIKFAGEQGVGLIPRTAGTSLAGQVVGKGIVVDVSRTFTEILEINPDEQWVRVQPGVIRNELNMALKPYGLLFGPETSTQNRAMMGGMLGNNSCGSNSVKYGSVRDHIIEVHAFLADGSKVVFKDLSAEEFAEKCAGPDCMETRLYQGIRDILKNTDVRDEIEKEFPAKEIPRRNTGYALDLLMRASCFSPEESAPFNFGKLIAGSEGTLCFVAEMKLHCSPLPKPVNGLQCAHFATVDEALRATQISIKHDTFAVELIDKYILDCTKRSIEHRDNRFFIQGDPGAVLVTEICGDTEAEVLEIMGKIEAEMRQADLGYAYPVLFGEDTVKIWNLRKAGLGLLGNMVGDEKPVPVIEDTAVRVADLPEYIREFNRRLKDRFGLSCVHYAHAGSGEIHLRPILNLKSAEGNRLFREVAQTIAELVKEYRGSLSGEHGDGRLRGEFLEYMIGKKNYAVVKQVKALWDPKNIFNPGKIVDTPKMNTSLRYEPDQVDRPIETVFDWSSTMGILGAAELCNGSGDCRKTHLSGGTMCPSYMATRNEKDTTRARANMLRQFLSGPNRLTGNPFNRKELKNVLDLCLSCKGCKKECPSTVDMAKLKAEFTQHYYDANGAPMRAKMVAGFAGSQKLVSFVPWAWNAVFGLAPLRKLANRAIGFHPERTIPMAPPRTLAKWFAGHTPDANAGKVGKVWLFNDEFTNYTDVEVGKATVILLEKLGYSVEIPEHGESGRTWLSKGFIRKAKSLINENVEKLKDIVSAEQPLVGIEPSAILTFRDEALDLAESHLKEAAETLAPNCLMLEEFIARESKAGRIKPEQFTDKPGKVLLHGHCFQKALAGTGSSVAALSLPANYTVEVIPSGCCGMAGSFGYETEHYSVSMQIGELVLFPAVRSAEVETIVAAPGTSCRHQVKDGTSRKAKHPAEVLLEALRG